jgi:hypothetical protein
MQLELSLALLVRQDHRVRKVQPVLKVRLDLKDRLAQ